MIISVGWSNLLGGALAHPGADIKEFLGGYDSNWEGG